jgi:hypothetical protein
VGRQQGWVVRPRPGDRQGEQRDRQDDAEDGYGHTADPGVLGQGDLLAALERTAIRQVPGELNGAQIPGDRQSDEVEDREDDTSVEPPQATECRPGKRDVGASHFAGAAARIAAAISG